jgi:hypothetical protein
MLLQWVFPILAALAATAGAVGAGILLVLLLLQGQASGIALGALCAIAAICTWVGLAGVKRGRRVAWASAAFLHFLAFGVTLSSDLGAVRFAAIGLVLLDVAAWWSVGQGTRSTQAVPPPPEPAP